MLRQSGKNKIKAVTIFHKSIHYRNICSNIVDVVGSPAFQFSETMLQDKAMEEPVPLTESTQQCICATHCLWGREQTPVSYHSSVQGKELSLKTIFFSSCSNHS